MLSLFLTNRAYLKGKLGFYRAENGERDKNCAEKEKKERLCKKPVTVFCHTCSALFLPLY